MAISPGNAIPLNGVAAVSWRLAFPEVICTAGVPWEYFPSGGFLPAEAPSLHRVKTPMDFTLPYCFSFYSNLSEAENFLEKGPNFVKAIPCRKLQGGFTDRDCGRQDWVLGRCLCLLGWLDCLCCLGAYVCRWERLDYLFCLSV